MRVVTVHCDRCGVKIEEGRGLIVIEAGPAPPIWPTDPASGRAALDLCRPCLDGLTAWLREAVGPRGESGAIRGA
jgi:hypothetical protein